MSLPKSRACHSDYYSAQVLCYATETDECSMLDLTLGYWLRRSLPSDFTSLLRSPPSASRQLSRARDREAAIKCSAVQLGRLQRGGAGQSKALQNDAQMDPQVSVISMSAAGPVAGPA